MNIFRHFFVCCRKYQINMFLCSIPALDGEPRMPEKSGIKYLFFSINHPSLSSFLFILLSATYIFCAPNKLIPPFFSTPSSSFHSNFFFFRFLSFFLLHFHALLDSTLLCSYICSTLALAISVKMFHRFEPFFCFSFFSSFFNFSSFRSRFFSFQFVSF